MIVSPADFGKLIVNETEKWGKVVKLSGARLLATFAQRRRRS
jgi:hypothetical protein